ncbi:3-deoxy-D-manno-octulosonic acid transferase [Changchengzhania lutea]|uniref:3-deoxy-D-manno-octulosonic acid transferase n=1 Tax=Changchengzhania lutea TaxID=2049305 RepID=UPI001FE49168|nr:glycosyltransferase N-terminal domain-containing protein [Changchengzhania lutea]
MYFSAKELELGILYSLGIFIVDFILKCIAPFNNKIKLGVDGRRNTFSILTTNLTPESKTLWFHCASLGEYEQGLPVFKELRKHYKAHKIVLSFFSPSGYAIRKNSPIADVVVYLPIDMLRNAKKFIDIVNPELSIFVKYDIWPNYLKALKNKNLSAILISAAFRKNQSYFKFYGSTLRKALFTFDHIFTQNEASKALLESIDYTNATVSGDTRFDRVTSQLDQDNTLAFIETFKNNRLCVVAGSTWPEDETLFINYLNHEASKDLKFIIAPHQIKALQIQQLKEKIKSSGVLFSEMENQDLASAQVFIVDTIGILTKIYSYADMAYVGGAMGNSGLHNILEPAVFGVPVIIGNNHDKFPEASALIKHGGMASVSNQDEFNKTLKELVINATKRTEMGRKNATYIKKNKGAVIHILDYLRI